MKHFWALIWRGRQREAEPVELCRFCEEWCRYPITPCSPCGVVANLNGHALCRWPLLAPRGGHLGDLVPPFLYLGRPWEQQDGHERVWNMIFIDFRTIWGTFFESFFGHRGLKFQFCSGLFPGISLYRLLIRKLDVWGPETRFSF